MRRVVLPLAVVVALAGCGGPSASVHGRVTCRGKPVRGTVRVSPVTDEAIAPGPAENATLDEDGRFTLRLKSVGKHRLVVRPSDIPFPPRDDEKYPCDLRPRERDLGAGDNEIDLELNDP